MAPPTLILGRYEVEKPVGAGAFGLVFRVLDRRTQQRRAMKVVPPGPHEAQLLAEFEQLAKLRHPSLPAVHDVGRTASPIANLAAGAPFFVADWIDGTPTDRLAWPTDRAAFASAIWNWLVDVTSALATIHAAGIVHADVSPANILVVGEGRHRRAILVDLGLASAQGARGTPAYMAPEALAGRVDARSDLYSLGVSALHVVLGRAPFTASSLGELVQLVIAGARPTWDLSMLPDPLADLIKRLAGREVGGRPASAASLMEELFVIAHAVGVDTSGRGEDSPRRGSIKSITRPAPASWPGAADVVADVGEILARSGVAILVGHTASGSREIADAAVMQWQLHRVAHRISPVVIAGSLDDVARSLGVPPSEHDRESRAWVERVARAASALPQAETSQTLVLFDLIEDLRAPDLLSALKRQSGPCPVVAIADDATAMSGGFELFVPPLSLAQLAELARSILGGTPPTAWLQGLAATSDRWASAATDLIMSAAAEREPYEVEWTEHGVRAITALRSRQLASVSPEARGLAVAIGAWGGRVPLDRALTTARAVGGDDARVGLAEVAELERVGLVHRNGDFIVMDAATVEALDETEVSTAAATALAFLALGPPESRDPLLLAPLLARAPSRAELAHITFKAADALLERGRPDLAGALAARITAPAFAGRARLVAAKAFAACGEYGDAAKAAEEALVAGEDPIEAKLVLGRAAQRAGDVATAQRVLADLHASHPANAEVAGAYARLLVTRSRYADARKVATNRALAKTPLAGLRAEAAGLASFYLGELDDADAAFADLERNATAARDSVTTGRAQSMRGMVAQQRGQLGIASERYREAARQLADAGESHAAATAELNLGTILVERGRASEALGRLTSAASVFAGLHANTECIAADLNLGNAQIAVGQFEAARHSAERAIQRAAEQPHLRAFAHLVLGDAHERMGVHHEAARAYRDALAIGNERADAHVQISAFIALAEAGHRDANGVDVEALCASEDDRDRWTIARGKLALHHRETTGVIELARACAEVAERAAAGDRLERAFRAAAVAAALSAAGGERALANALALKARAANSTMVAAAAAPFRAALAADHDIVRLANIGEPPKLVAQEGDSVRAPLASNMRRLLTLSRRLNSEVDVERILDEVIDTAIDLTEAERGFLLLRGKDGELAPRVARNFASGELTAVDAPTVSRSIAERAAQTGEPVMTVDAGVDERFGAAASVAALRLRSVLAVPLRQRGAVIGCIYVDHRLRGGAFDDGAAALLSELADIAAIAIENARLTGELRETTRAVDELNGKLSAELAEKDAELLRVRAVLPDRERLRNRYDAIAGRSPAMLRMLDIVDRAAATALPVVIIGESGTGKELVARALHDHGPRAAAAFVAINCSAVPEQLLESELFGHVRGAFTGAERDRRGLFEVADGGTLFLDEIADTSPAMQAKLLRVLQDGIIRRVGDSATRKIDVRVIAASQKPLAELVAQGRFREDLRFRIEVIQVPIPALREREGDVPVLVERLLSRLAPGKQIRLTRAAVRALTNHRWPGNVRELENALARGVAMGGEVIDVVDLPEVLATSVARPEPTKPVMGEDLRLKPALTATEHAYIGAAMTRAKNNQTVAARLLGLSRFGLQKKLRRLAGDDAEED